MTARSKPGDGQHGSEANGAGGTPAAGDPSAAKPVGPRRERYLVAPLPALSSVK